MARPLTVSLFAVALAGCGLLTTVGVIVAMDTFGPVSDNAQGIAEMSGDVSREGAQILTELDAVGNTTKAITKGIAIATAVLAATALFGSYATSVFEALRRAPTPSEDELSLLNFQRLQPGRPRRRAPRRGRGVPLLRPGDQRRRPRRRRGGLRGAPPVPRDPRDHGGHRPSGVRQGRRHRHQDSLRELVTPGLLAVLAPVAVGFGLGVTALAGFLAGAIGTGTLMAVFLANSGGAWDNAKKLVEDGHHGGKGSDAHEATVIGDTVGDPFKDTAGPAINPLIKVMNLVSLLIASAVVSMSVGEDQNDALRIVDRARGGRDHRRRGLHLQAARGRHQRRRRARGRPSPRRCIRLTAPAQRSRHRAPSRPVTVPPAAVARCDHVGHDGLRIRARPGVPA